MKILVLTICVLLALTSASPVENSDSVNILTRGSNKFALSLYHELSKISPGNMLVSPLSIQILLALTYAGAKGTAANEISETLEFPADFQQVLNAHRNLLDQLKAPVLKLANKMFVDKEAEIKPEFQKIGIDYFDSPAEMVNFKHDPNGAVQLINKWAAEKTNNLITQLFKPGSVRSDTSLLLTNAVHFKADWKEYFKMPTDGEKSHFHMPEGKMIDVTMMEDIREMSYMHHNQLDVHAIEVPYQGEKFSMVIVLPFTVDGLKELESKLTSIDLSKDFSNWSTKQVKVKIPVFTMEQTMELNDVMQSLGMRTMFNSPDLSGISDAPLAVSKVVQKTLIKVNKEGTEAAAASGMGFVPYSSFGTPHSTVLFKADHPFLFYIVHKETNTIIFIGSLKDPSQAVP